jgi:hypothetical protein
MLCIKIKSSPSYWSANLLWYIRFKKIHVHTSLYIRLALTIMERTKSIIIGQFCIFRVYARGPTTTPFLLPI